MLFVPGTAWAEVMKTWFTCGYKIVSINAYVGRFVFDMVLFTI